MPKDIRDEIYERATELYGHHEWLHIDLLTLSDIFEGESGTWVRAWVLVPKEKE